MTVKSQFFEITSSSNFFGIVLFLLSSLVDKILVTPKSVDKIVVTLKSDIVATLWQHRANFVTTLQSCNFAKCLMSVQRCVNVVSASILIFLYADNVHLNL